MSAPFRDWWRQLLALHLAATLALAGGAGLSPLLHQWLEHGGRGAPHIHHGASKAHPVRVPGRLARGHAPFTLPRLSAHWLRQMAHRLAHAAEQSGKPAAPADAPGHQHHSLAQTLASGLIEVPAPVEVLPARARLNFPIAPPAQTRAVARALDRQSAGRAPPAAHG